MKSCLSSTCKLLTDSGGLRGPSLDDRGDRPAMTEADSRLSAWGLSGGGIDILARSTGVLSVSVWAFRLMSAGFMTVAPRSECVEVVLAENLEAGDGAVGLELLEDEAEITAVRGPPSV